jgi:hypothetical protein
MATTWGGNGQADAPGSGWRDPPAEDPSLTPFERAARQIAEEERRLRGLAEARLRELLRLLVDVASACYPDALDAAIRADPFFLASATLAEWRRLLVASPRPGRGDDRTGWRDADAAEIARLREEVRRLEAELAALHAARTGEGDVDAAEVAGPTGTLTTSPIAEQPPTVEQALDEKPTPTVSETPALALPALPALPRLAPGRFSDQLRNWPRDALVLAALGVTGWSMRLAVAEVAAANLDKVQPAAGSLRRVFDNLARRHLWCEERVVLRGLRPLEVEAQSEQTTLVLVRLTDLGKEALRACGIEPIAGEWEQLEARRGAGLTGLEVGLVCALAYQARRRGWQTTVGPADVPQADLVIEQSGETWPVLVVSETSPTDTDLRRAQPLARAGGLGLAVLTASGRTALVQAVQSVGISVAAATDLQTLIEDQAASGPFWLARWPA